MQHLQPNTTLKNVSYTNPTISYKMTELLLIIQYYLIIFATKNMLN